MEVVKIGDRTPDFTLPDTEKKLRGLKEFVGDKKVILAFYPGTFTSVCTKEMCTFRDSMARLNGLNARVVGISVDGPFANKEFAEKNFIEFPLLSDYKRGVVNLYGITTKDFAGLKGYDAAKRSIFVLDNLGHVIYAWVSENLGVEPDYAEIERVLGAERVLEEID